jgi:BlaI family transcriptional regulator, penicillinase repressor
VFAGVRSFLASCEGGIVARKPSTLPTDGELRLLRLLWEQGPMAAADLTDRLGEPKLAKNTVLTTLKILEAKGFAAHQPVGRTFIYRAAVDPKSIRRSVVEGIVSRFFHDSPKDLILHFLDAEYVDESQAQHIRDLLEMDREP